MPSRQPSESQNDQLDVLPKIRGPPPEVVREVVGVFDEHASLIDSEKFGYKSNEVLSVLGGGLATLGFDVETGKKMAEKVPIPVLFGRNGVVENSFEADA